jgi:hypothetical protein
MAITKDQQLKKALKCCHMCSELEAFHQVLQLTRETGAYNQSTTSSVLLTIFFTNMWASVASSNQARASQQVWEVALGSCLS